MAKRERHIHPKNPPNSHKKALRQVPEREIKSALLDIIIPVYGRFDLLARCLHAIPDAAGDINYRIIVVDNNSPEDEAKLFYVPDNPAMWDVRLIRNEKNEGFPRACNKGYATGKSPLVLFLNSDVILDPGAISLMVSDLDDPQIAITAPKLVFPEDAMSYGLESTDRVRPAGKIQHVGLESNINGELIHIFLGWNENHPRPNAKRDSYAVTGACLMTRRHVFYKAGGFFEGYGLGTYEDVDYCLTVRDLGYNIVVNTKARGIHYTGATAESYKMGYPLSMNQLMFLQRWATRMNYTEWNVW